VKESKVVAIGFVHCCQAQCWALLKTCVKACVKACVKKACVKTHLVPEDADACPHPGCGPVCHA
jgi:hypothetical protein